MCADGRKIEFGLKVTGQDQVVREIGTNEESAAEEEIQSNTRRRLLLAHALGRVVESALQAKADA